MPTRKNDRNPYFGHNIRQLRMSFDISQDELAEKLKIPSKHGGVIVSGWERGEREPSLAMVCKIADFFGVTCDWLLGRTSKNQFTDKVYTLIVKGEDKISEEDKVRLYKVIKAFTD